MELWKLSKRAFSYAYYVSFGEIEDLKIVLDLKHTSVLCYRKDLRVWLLLTDTCDIPKTSFLFYLNACSSAMILWVRWEFVIICVYNVRNLIVHSYLTYINIDINSMWYWQFI